MSLHSVSRGERNGHGPLLEKAANPPPQLTGVLPSSTFGKALSVDYGQERFVSGRAAGDGRCAPHPRKPGKTIGACEPGTVSPPAPERQRDQQTLLEPVGGAAVCRVLLLTPRTP